MAALTGPMPVAWNAARRMAEALGAGAKRPVVFECVGVPGVLNQIVTGAPLFSRVVIVGVCMQPDTIEPAIAIQKEVELRFVFGHSPLEYRDALYMIADGKVRCEPMITGVVGLAGVEDAFSALGDPKNMPRFLWTRKGVPKEAASFRVAAELLIQCERPPFLQRRLTAASGTKRQATTKADV